MEQNDLSTDGSMQTSSSSATTGGIDSGFSRTSSTTPETAGLTDRARDLAGSAQEKLADVGSTVRERASTAKDSLADALESGAEKLRQRAQGPQGGHLAGATVSGTVATGDGRVVAMGDRVAGGMQATADFIREADLDSLKTSLEKQIKEHPGRTLAIAVGVGYLLGKAFRNR